MRVLIHKLLSMAHKKWFHIAELPIAIMFLLNLVFVCTEVSLKVTSKDFLDLVFECIVAATGWDRGGAPHQTSQSYCPMIGICCNYEKSNGTEIPLIGSYSAG